MATEYISPLMLLRVKAGISQQELAASLGVTQTTISRWETGKANPQLTIRQAKTLCILLNVGIQELPDSFAPQPIHGDLGTSDE
jgi:putative transcriptional regulator